MTVKNLLRILKSYPKKYTISLLLIIVATGGYFYFFNNKSEAFEYIIAEKGNLTQEVSVTGKVRSSSKVNLAFESTGKVAGVYVDIGDKVYEGQTLAFLSNAQYQAQYSQAQASFEAEQSKLDELKKGTRIEELDVQRIKVQNAEQSLSDAKNNLFDKIKDSYTKSDDAVRNRADQLFNNPRSTNPDLNFSTDFMVEIEVESKRLLIEDILNNWNLELIGLDSYSEDLSTYYNSSKNNLSEINYFLNKLAYAVNGMSANSTVTQTTIDGYKTSIATARTNINTAITNLSTADEKLRTAEASLALERQTLVLKESGATDGQLKEQESRVKSAEANVSNYRALIAKTIIYSPISGVVTKVDIEKGEIIQLNAPAITVISGAEFEIEANIPEADISKVHVGDIAKITLDAYEDEDVFEAKIISIEPAETVIEGVSTYKTILQFTIKDEKIRSGMTANIDILTGIREDVISIPARLLRINDETHVLVLKGEESVDVIIETGMRSTDGRVEIISGLEEGDKVITSR
ncbi:efflux RND transporter periplasmic adaptor subunit [Patescibacteria group bacterium]|nr:efflux RND transporter periplasmic adaptor subunit [Patescibacteria group bacterium]